MPELLQKADQNDYLTDDESDDAADFEIRVPELDQLIGQFEKEDEQILKFHEDQKKYATDLEIRGFEPEPRYQIVNQEADRIKLLNQNIEMQRQKQVALLPGMIQDLNEKITNTQNKVYLR